MKKIISLLTIVLFVGFLTNVKGQVTPKVSDQGKHPKNIILMIGDGMGLSQMYATYTYKGGQLNMLRCEQIALVTTFSANDYITDSGAAGTALACGVKTNNGMIGMTPDSLPAESILKLADKNGLSTGMVVSCDITHATPAAFVASVPSRKLTEDIAIQILDTDIDVFIGGGHDRFSKREDKLNLIDSLTARNYQIVETLSGLSQINNGKVAAMLYPEHPPKMSEGRGDMLGIGTEKAIELLSKNSAGFFMMVEGSQIDWGGHDNNVDYIVAETVDFDRAVGIALDFAKKDGETLVIITADHETGGMSNLEGSFKENRAGGKFTTPNHSAAPVPLYAFGPGSERFKGMIDNTDVFRLMKELYGF